MTFGLVKSCLADLELLVNSISPDVSIIVVSRLSAFDHFCFPDFYI